MARVKNSVEQIIHKLWEAEILLGQRQTVKDICLDKKRKKGSDSNFSISFSNKPEGTN